MLSRIFLAATFIALFIAAPAQAVTVVTMPKGGPVVIPSGGSSSDGGEVSGPLGVVLLVVVGAATLFAIAVMIDLATDFRVSDYISRKRRERRAAKRRLATR